MFKTQLRKTIVRPQRNGQLNAYIKFVFDYRTVHDESQYLLLFFKGQIIQSGAHRAAEGSQVL